MAAPVEVDSKLLLLKMQEIDFAKETGNTGDLSMADILKQISLIKEKERLKKAPPPGWSYTPPGGWQDKPGSPTFKKSPKSPKVWKSPIKDFSISQFRHVEPKWEKTFYMESDLQKSLYRVPDFDVSGKKIVSLTRDEPKDVTTWQPVSPITVDNDLPRPSVDLYTHTYRNSLLHHSSKLVSVVEDDYTKMPEYTERLRKIKASTGADLFNLQQEKGKLEEGTKSLIESRRMRASTSHGPYSSTNMSSYSSPLKNQSRASTAKNSSPRSTVRAMNNAIANYTPRDNFGRAVDFDKSTITAMYGSSNGSFVFPTQAKSASNSPRSPANNFLPPQRASTALR